MKRFKEGQQIWWGEFIVRVTKVTEEGRVLQLNGTNLRPEDECRLRPLGIGGTINLACNGFMRSDAPNWKKMLVMRSKCGSCGRWTLPQGDCSRCGRISCWKGWTWGVYNLWIHWYMILWLIDSNVGHGSQKWARFIPAPIRRQLSNLGRWMWCNEWRGTGHSLRKKAEESKNRIEWVKL